jgi:hypothetical protein
MVVNDYPGDGKTNPVEKDTSLSSKSLFHYTEKENLKGILRDGFRPRYSLEKMHFFEDIPESPKKAYIPMVSFCDIPKELSEEHRRIYGAYAIGVSKEWAKNEVGVNPIIYIRENSLLYSHFKALGKAIYGLNFNSITEAIFHAANTDEHLFFTGYLTTPWEQASHFEHLRPDFLEIMRYVKPYFGFYEHKHYKNTAHKFYDEREWRYVPPIANEEGIIETVPGFDADVHVPEDLIRGCEKKIKPIKFDVEDIDCIIVQTKSEVEEFRKYLNELNSNNQKLDLNKIEIVAIRL